MRFLATFLLAVLVAGTATAAGHGHSSGGRVAVHGYTRADGTYVSGYTRAAPGSRGGSSYTRSESGSASALSDDTNWSAGLGGPHAHVDASEEKAEGCVYAAVMTDAQIAACRSPREH